MSRPSWDEYMMALARHAASRSTCIRRQVGCVIERGRRVLATGYNGAPSGAPHCLDIGCLRESMGIPSGERAELCRAVHSEANAIAQAARHGISLEGATAHVTVEPCAMCFKALHQAGVVRIVWADVYPDRLTLRLSRECGWDGNMNEMRRVR